MKKIQKKALVILIAGILALALALAVISPCLVDADETELDEIGTETDFSSGRLLVQTDSPENFSNEDADVYEYEGTLLLQYESEEQAQKAYERLSEEDVAVSPDQAFYIAEEEISEETSESLEETPDVSEETTNVQEETAGENAFEIASSAENNASQSAIRTEIDVALIDTGAPSSENVVSRISLIDDNPEDENGHGSRMATFMIDQNPDISILSIKAVDANGQGSLSAVIAGIEYAISANAKIINISLSASFGDKCEIFENVVEKAIAQGVIVVGAAGNNGTDVANFVPGNVESVIVVGSAYENGIRRECSNFGDTVDVNVVSENTSQAAALLSGFLSCHLLEDIKENLNQGFVYSTNYQNQESQVNEQINQVTYAEGLFETAETISTYAATTYTVNDATWDMANKRWYFRWYSLDGTEAFCAHFGVSYSEAENAYSFSHTDTSQLAVNLARVKYLVDSLGSSKYSLDDVMKRWIIQKYCWESGFNVVSGSNSWHLDYQNGWADMIYGKVVSDALQLNVTGYANIYKGSGIQDMATVWYSAGLLSLTKEFDSQYSPAGAVYEVYDSNNNSCGMFIVDANGVGHHVDVNGSDGMYSYDSGEDGLAYNMTSWDWINYDFGRLVDGKWYCADAATTLAVAPGIYTVKEVVAPISGKYQLNDQVYTVTVSENETVNVATKDILIPELCSIMLPLTGSDSGIIWQIAGLVISVVSLSVLLVQAKKRRI